MTQTFDPATHVYQIDGQSVPSVTQCLAESGIVDPTWFSPEAATRGTYVHEATALLDAGKLDIESLDEQLKGYVAAWERCKKERGIVIRGIEVPVYHDTYRFAGTIDRVYEQNGYERVLDLKTNQIPKWAALQIAGYCIARRLTAGASVALHDDGTYSWQDYDAATIRKASQVFLAALTVTHWKRGNK